MVVVTVPPAESLSDVDVADLVEARSVSVVGRPSRSTDHHDGRSTPRLVGLLRRGRKEVPVPSRRGEGNPRRDSLPCVSPYRTDSPVLTSPNPDEGRLRTDNILRHVVSLS